MNNIFEGVRVLELANVLAGPSVGQFFAECGAQVIKIENPASGGDVTRSWKLQKERSATDISAYFSAVNSGKMSLALNLSRQQHYEVFLDLLKVSDIVIASYKPGDAEKFGLDYSTLSKLNPQLIYGQISGYGERVNKVGYDAILQAESGFMYMNGEPGGASVKMPVALIDILAAHQLKEGILLAYIHLLKTLEGGKVSVSLLDTAISSLANQATNFLLAGHNPQKMGAEHPNIAPYGSIFHCKDGGQIVLAVGTDKQFQALCDVLEIEGLSQNNNYTTNNQRVKNREQLNIVLQRAFLKTNSSNLLRQLEQRKVPAGKLQSVEEVFKSGAADHLQIKADLKTVGLRNFVADTSFSDETSHITPPPSLDQHKKAILTDILGFSELEAENFS